MKGGFEIAFFGILLLGGCSFSLKRDFTQEEDIRRGNYSRNLEKDYVVVPLLDVGFGYQISEKDKKREEGKRYWLFE